MNAADFNAMYEVGVPVFAYPGARPEDIPSATRLVTRTRSKAQAVGLDREGVVWVEGHGAYISLTHVDVVSEDVWEAARAAQRVAAVNEDVASRDTLPEWLYSRFNRVAQPWQSLSNDDRSYWEHEAAAVRRAAERGGFKRLGHASPSESVPALLATIKELQNLRQPLIDALRTVHESMTSCVGDEWAMEWLGEVWSQLPLGVRALAGDQDATAEIAAEHGALPAPGGQGAVR
ncbi:hypothetical protein M2164_005862 [Streptomyces sp. SAI-208]|uniref:hypothetical protein n=1 Tax=Streptomyces sp. SAI-208 TaxID=2940550 RepID=UPI0024766FFE|nr:hypothetical protein [Streptomyces sp. SAI-208]MDH6610227.1 hypothetical protein [Streptomyces sp. SAI-208]